MTEESLASRVPLWSTQRDEDLGITYLVTPAADYVGCVRLQGRDVRFDSDEDIAQVCEGVRRFVGKLDDDTVVTIIHQVGVDAAEHIDRYGRMAEGTVPPALARYVRSREAYLRAQRLRVSETYLFFCNSKSSTPALLAHFTERRGEIGMPLPFVSVSRVERAHQKKLQDLVLLRDRILGRLNGLRLGAVEMSPDEVRALHYRLLNPGRARLRMKGPEVQVKEELWDARLAGQEGDHLRELTEAEQLVFEDAEEGRNFLRQGDVYRRVHTLKLLPENGTDYCHVGPALELLAPIPGGGEQPFGYTIAISLHVKAQRNARFGLAANSRIVGIVRHLKERMGFDDAEDQTDDAAKDADVRDLLAELKHLGSKVVSFSFSLLLDAPSLPELNTLSEACKRAFTDMGNSELLDEEVTQLPAFLSMLPGAGAYQLRRKACTSRNAADLLPLYAHWNGCASASTLLPTVSGDLFRFHFQDKSFGVNSHHGMGIADTGGGKSVTAGALVLDAFAAGMDAVLVDNGGSWRRLTEIMGGTYLPVDPKTPFAPFLPYKHMLEEDGRTLDNASVLHVVRYIELCVVDRNLPAFDKLQKSLVAKGVRHLYERTLRERPEERPLIGQLRAAIHEVAVSEDERGMAKPICDRLYEFCEGAYATFLNTPSKLRFDAPLLTFDMGKVAKDPVLRPIAMATIMDAVTARAAARGKRAVFKVDEAHEFLGDETGAAFLDSGYRKMRKWGVSMWTYTQRFNEYLTSPGGAAIIGNSSIKLLLRHLSGHDLVINHFKLPPKVAEAFHDLDFKPGFYSDALLMYGPRTATLRLGLQPLAYWLLTTDKDDVDVIAGAMARNPRMSQLGVLEHLAERYPRGANFHGLVPASQSAA